MKKLLLVIATVFVAAVAVSSAAADGPVYQANEFGCGIAVRDGEGFTLIVTENSSFTIYASGKAVLRCTGWTEPGSRYHLNPGNTGFGCGYTDSNYAVNLPNWNTDVKKGGEVQLECRGHVDLNSPTEPLRMSSAATSAGNAG